MLARQSCSYFLLALVAIDLLAQGVSQFDANAISQSVVCYALSNSQCLVNSFSSASFWELVSSVRSPAADFTIPETT